jgi:methylated-DNA-protein-cysteine methyltransferase-like protein
MFVEIRNVVRKIPRGKVATYGAVAEAAGFPGNARRVAWALRKTDGRLPWHRVLGSGGKILLPQGSGCGAAIAVAKRRCRVSGRESVDGAARVPISRAENSIMKLL